MSKKDKTGNNLKLAGVFILLVSGLILLSIFFKIIFLIKDSKFDGSHKFNVGFLEENKTRVVSFSPQNKSMSILKIDRNIDEDNLSQTLLVPIDGLIKVRNRNPNEKNISSVLLGSILPFQNSLKDLTVIDTLRLFLFSRSVSPSLVYERELSQNFNDGEKSTIIALSFTDPTIYKENKSIEIKNATSVSGLGTRLATLITNIGGSVILVSNSEKYDNKSRIIYSGEDSYTVNKLSGFLGFPKQKEDIKGISDVIIIIGADKVKSLNF